MPHALASRAPAAAAAALVLLLATCAPPPQPGVIYVQETDSVNIRVEGCTAESTLIEVNPWAVVVERGRPLRWTTNAGQQGVDSVAIQAVTPGHWPFPWAQPGQAQRRVARPQQPTIQAGNAGGPRGIVTYRYRILVYCDGRILDIDPDIIITDPR
jgi:hypothetical protein